MRDHAELNPLLDDLLDDTETLRAASLERGLAALRRKKRARQMRPLLGGSAAVVLLAAALVWWPGEPEVKPEVGTMTVEPLLAQSMAAVSERKIQIISEDELLAQFPERAVAIVGPKEHRQLVFLDVDATAGVATVADQH